MKFYKNQLIELLAPVRDMDSVKVLLKTDCDAIYLGGKQFNMRMHAAKLNFTLEEIEVIVNQGHRLNKKVYITVNNWVDDSQIEGLTEYLKALEKISVDAIIIQDLAIVRIMKNQGINIPLHASVMMNTYNYMQLLQLEALGFTRFVASRELPLEAVAELTKKTTLECEYFVSGDMCTVHGAQCYYSGLMFNKSANQGKCFKLCRWKYNLKVDDQLLEKKHYLAAKDLDLSNHVESLILSGVNSFKIEGRRKPSEEILPIVDLFSEEIKGFLENKPSQIEDGDRGALYPRSTSTAYAFGNPGTTYLNEKNESNPEKLRIFSKQGREPGFTRTSAKEIATVLYGDEGVPEKIDARNPIQIKVKVETFDQAMAILPLNIHTVYVCLESLNHTMISPHEVETLLKNKGETKIYVVLPQMVSDAQFVAIEAFLAEIKGLEGVMVSDLGSLYRLKKHYKVITDFGLNITNQQSLTMVSELGAESSTLSIELKPTQLKTLLNSALPKEMLVQGPLSAMLLEIDYFKAYGARETMALIDSLGVSHPLYKDSFSRTHVMTTKELCLYPVLKPLLALGLDAIQIEGRLSMPEALVEIVEQYKVILENDGSAFFYKQKESYSFQALWHMEDDKSFVI